MTATKRKKKKPSSTHLEWVIDSRARNNRAALSLLLTFEAYPDQISEAPYDGYAQQLVAIAFSLWRAAFLADRSPLREDRIDAAEQFLRRMLADNAIGYSQDVEWRDWTFNYYTQDAKLRLEKLEEDWDELVLGDLYPPKGKRTSRNRWDLLHTAFDQALDQLTDELGDLILDAED